MAENQPESGSESIVKGHRKEKTHFAIEDSSDDSETKHTTFKDSSQEAHAFKAGLPVLKFSKTDDEYNFPKVKVSQHEPKFTSSDESDKKLTYIDADAREELEDEEESSITLAEDSSRIKFPEPSKKGMRFEYGRCPKSCELFMGVVEFAKIFVDDIIDEALRINQLLCIFLPLLLFFSDKGRDFRQQSTVRFIEGFEYQEGSSDSGSIESIGTYVCVLEWPTIENFTVMVGTAKITEYLSYWKLEEDWKFCINFLKGISDTACDYYQYEAIFSIPCKQYPIPQATATVFFVFEVSRIKPKHCLVDVKLLNFINSMSPNQL